MDPISSVDGAHASETFPGTPRPLALTVVGLRLVLGQRVEFSGEECPEIPDGRIASVELEDASGADLATDEYSVCLQTH
jgi:hypothetical protein